MTKMLNSENLLGDSGLEPHSTPTTADKILYNYAIEQCQAAALDELFGNPEECFQVGVIFFDFFYLPLIRAFKRGIVSLSKNSKSTLWKICFSRKLKCLGNQV